jgi:hypothetical protein
MDERINNILFIFLKLVIKKLKGNAVQKGETLSFPSQALPWPGSTGLISAPL